MTRRRDPELQAKGLCSICEKPLPPPVRVGGRPRAFHEECKKNRALATKDVVVVTPENRIHKNGGPICGATKVKDKTPCCQPAGWATSHPGFGRCKWHGGANSNGIKAAAKEKALSMLPVYGGPISIDPHTALLQEVHRTAGHVQWLGAAIQQFGLEKVEAAGGDEKAATGALVQFNEMFGYSPTIWLKLYQEERTNLVKFSKAAIDAGVAERAVRVVEEQGRQLAMVIRAFIMDPDLQLTPAQQANATEVMRKHLLSMSAAPVETTAELTA